MKTYSTPSSDSTLISISTSGFSDTALLFVHGWLGNKHWWDKQVEAFKSDYLVATMDLAGHGDSGKSRKDYTSKLYADDIVAVAKSLPAKEVILVGHSMSGAYALEAGPHIKNLKAIVVIDTLKDLDLSFSPEQIDSILNLYSGDFGVCVEKVLPDYLFVETTPPAVKEKIKSEFLSQSDFARPAIEALYFMDMKKFARAVDVPLRAINSDNSPTNIENNRKYLKDYNYKVIKRTGHYPMLEDPEAFNSALKETLIELG